MQCVGCGKHAHSSTVTRMSLTGCDTASCTKRTQYTVSVAPITTVRNRNTLYRVRCKKLAVRCKKVRNQLSTSLSLPATRFHER